MTKLTCADARARTYVLASRVCMLIRVLGPMFWHACSMPVQREGRAQLRAAFSSADVLATFQRRHAGGRMSVLGPMFWHASADARAIGMFWHRGRVC